MISIIPIEKRDEIRNRFHKIETYRAHHIWGSAVGRELCDVLTYARCDKPG